MPESVSPSPSPVGIIISPGTPRAAGSRLWAYLWSAEPGGEHDARRQPEFPAPERKDGTSEPR